MRFLLPLLAASSLLAQTAPHTPRGPAARPETLAWHRYAAQSKAALASLNQPKTDALPPAPAGVADLAFADFFGPIGDRGLEYSAQLRALSGRRVRLVGYMVREPARAPGVFRFAPWPVAVEADGFCTTDDSPATTAHVIDTAATGQPAWQPGRLVLIGTLDVGFRTESDGRNSHVRLLLDTSATSRP